MGDRYHRASLPRARRLDHRDPGWLPRGRSLVTNITHRGAAKQQVVDPYAYPCRAMTDLGRTPGARAAPDARIVRSWAAVLLSTTVAACLGDPLIARGPRIDVTSADRAAVWVRTLGAPLAVQCTLIGVAAPRTPVAARSSTGVVAGSECGALTVVRSGLDTLVLRAAGVESRVPIAVALPAQLTSDSADRLTIDGLPPDTADWWAPSARLNSRGQVEVYAAAYRTIPPDSLPVGSLYRLVQVSTGDPLHFPFDRVVLQPEADQCSLMGSGIQNVAIVPRAEGQGFRMLLTPCSFNRPHSHVLSAVSPHAPSRVAATEVHVSD